MLSALSSRDRHGFLDPKRSGGAGLTGLPERESFHARLDAAAELISPWAEIHVLCCKRHVSALCFALPRWIAPRGAFIDCDIIYCWIGGLCGDRNARRRQKEIAILSERILFVNVLCATALLSFVLYLSSFFVDLWCKRFTLIITRNCEHIFCG